MDTSYPGGPVPGYYCPLTMATDPTNHAAMMLYAFDNVDGGDGEGDFYGPVVIATYTADSKGNLNTTSTYKNMAVAETGGGPMRMSPSGKLLAVGGRGLEIFHFNGGSPATKYKMLLPTESIGSILWDNDNHMYALGSDAKGAKTVGLYGHPDQRHGSARLTLLDRQCREHIRSNPLKRFRNYCGLIKVARSGFH